MRYLVTGGCGFIGSHLCDALVAAKHEVHILDDLSSGKRENPPPHARVQVGDISNPADVASAMEGVDACFHLAAIASVAKSEKEWLRTHQVNLSGTINVFKAAAKRRIPVVYASSAAIYGDACTPPLDETMRGQPVSAYGADKLGCEQHALVAWLVHGVPNVGLRFFNVYGPRQDPTSTYAGVISIFARAMLAGQPILINGDGKQARDFIYIADVVCAVLRSMELLQNKTLECSIFNICTGIATSVGTLAAQMAAALGIPLQAAHGPARPGDVQMSLGNPALAKKILGCVAEMPLAEGLSRTVEHVRLEIAA